MSVETGDPSEEEMGGRVETGAAEAPEQKQEIAKSPEISEEKEKFEQALLENLKSEAERHYGEISRGLGYPQNEEATRSLAELKQLEKENLREFKLEPAFILSPDGKIVIKDFWYSYTYHNPAGSGLPPSERKKGFFPASGPVLNGAFN